MIKKNRVWIELDKPRDKDHAAELCELANNMLARLRESDDDTKWKGFWYHEEREAYCFTFCGQTGEYKELADRGEWFNLDYFGRPEDEVNI